MVLLPPIANAASGILTQVLETAQQQAVGNAPSPNLSQIQNPQNDADHKIAGGTNAAKLSEQLFSLDHQSVAKLKMQLFEKVGEALGVDLDAFANFEDFAKEVEAAYRRVLRDEGALAIKAIERETGLDKLGLSLRDVVESMKDPDENDKVSQALIEEYNLDRGDKDDKDADKSHHHLEWF
jgi:hypothetical protein